MQPKSAGRIWDLVTALRAIQGFVAEKSWDDYAGDALLRSGVERQFEIAGEAMSVLRRSDPETAGRIPHVHEIVGMRNVLIHLYAEINDRAVWQTATRHLNEVIQVAEQILTEAGPA